MSCGPPFHADHQGRSSDAVEVSAVQVLEDECAERIRADDQEGAVELGMGKRHKVTYLRRVYSHAITT